MSQIQTINGVPSENYFEHGAKQVSKSRRIKKYLQKVVYKKGGLEHADEGVFFSGDKWHIEVANKDSDSILFKVINAAKGTVYWAKVTIQEARNQWDLRKHQGLDLMEGLIS